MFRSTNQPVWFLTTQAHQTTVMLALQRELVNKSITEKSIITNPQFCAAANESLQLCNIHEKVFDCEDLADCISNTFNCLIHVPKTTLLAHIGRLMSSNMFNSNTEYTDAIMNMAPGCQTGIIEPRTVSRTGAEACVSLVFAKASTIDLSVAKSRQSITTNASDNSSGQNVESSTRLVERSFVKKWCN